jgi:predicted DNA-binding transcriptional regulator AlpA
MVRKRFYTIEEMGTILGKSIAAIHGHLARKQFDAVPPPIKLGRRLAWIVDAVDAWIDEKAIQADAKAKAVFDNSLPPTRRRGRPTKAEQKARGGQ